MALAQGLPDVAHFQRRGGEMCCEEVPLSEVARTVGTPAFVYSAGAVRAALAEIRQSLAPSPHLIAYAVKANGSLAILAELASSGCGADIVSVGELLRCLEAGMPPERIVFSGVGKRDDEIAAALSAAIRSIHIESSQELDVVETIAAQMGTPARISLRVNPDVDAESHPYVATGLHDTKFGLEIASARALLPRILGSEHLVLEGLTCHIGSQLGTTAPLREAVEITARFAKECAEAGAPIRSLDAGGGWPIPYGDEERPFPSARDFGEAIRGGIDRAGAADMGLEIIVEPGRALVGNAGVLVTRVLFVKESPKKRFVIVDAAMTELIRPALYQAHHGIEPVVTAGDAPVTAADVVGPVCETGDFFAQDRLMPPVARGDLLVIHSAGAYGMSMASQYNARPRPPEVLVSGNTYRVVRDREKLADLQRGERL